MGSTLRQCIVLLTVVNLVLLSVGPSAFAQSASQEEEMKSGKMVADILLVRPLGLVSTVAGTAAFIVSLPFSLIGRNAKSAAQKLVVEPAIFTFVRPLGEF